MLARLQALTRRLVIMALARSHVHTHSLLSHSLRQLDRVPCAALSYAETVQTIIAADCISGLFLRGLGTKLLSNGVQAMLFTVCWRYFEEVLAKRQASKAKKQ